MPNISHTFRVLSIRMENELRAMSGLPPLPPNRKTLFTCSRFKIQYDRDFNTFHYIKKHEADAKDFGLL